MPALSSTSLASAHTASTTAAGQAAFNASLLLKIVLPIVLVALIAVGAAVIWCMRKPLYHPNAVVNLRKPTAPAYEADSAPPGYVVEDGVTSDKVELPTFEEVSGASPRMSEAEVQQRA